MGKKKSELALPKRKRTSKKVLVPVETIVESAPVEIEYKVIDGSGNTVKICKTKERAEMLVKMLPGDTQIMEIKL